MKDFNVDLPFGLEQEFKLWIPYFSNYPYPFKEYNNSGKFIKILSIEKTDRNPEAQQYGDFVIHFDNGVSKFVEPKTRRDTWIDQFERDHCLAIETKSNVELGRDSSTIFHSKADWYVYGFAEVVEEEGGGGEKLELRYPMVFDRQKLAEHVKERYHAFVKKYSPNLYYKTENCIVPLGPITPFLALPPTDNFIKRILRKHRSMFVVSR